MMYRLAIADFNTFPQNSRPCLSLKLNLYAYKLKLCLKKPSIAFTFELVHLKVSCRPKSAGQRLS